MTADEISRLANQAARRAGFARATAVAFDRRRKYGCAVIKRVAPAKGRKAVVIVAVPASWGVPPEPEVITVGKPKTLVSFTSPEPSESRRLGRYTRLIRFNGHRLSYRIAYKTDPGNSTLDTLAKMLRAGTLKVDLGQVQRPGETDRELAKMIECGE